MSLRRIATYRLQLTPEFGFDAAAAVVPYLARLGVSHVYCSPYLRAAGGSTHGYDIVDHAHINDELGGPRALARFHAALAGNSLHQLIDIVPNHMAIGDRRNRQWWDVLRHGQASVFARWFDIDWDRGPILIPVLGDRYGREIERGAIQLVADDDDLVVAYHEHRYPLRPGSIDPDDAEAIAACNSDALAMHALLADQHHRLVSWRIAADELNYRRFFDVNTLASLRIEDPEVFAAVHRLPLQWLAAGVAEGLRVDHPDGLRDPAAYLDRLRAAAPPGTWVIVEKILARDEGLRDDWACDGTTGYEVMALVDGLFVDRDGAAALTATYQSFVGTRTTFADVVATSKRVVIDRLLGSDLARVVRLAAAVCAGKHRTADASRREIAATVTEMVVAFPVYRTYVDDAGASDADRVIVEQVRVHVAALPTIEPDLVEVLCAALLRDDDSPEAEEFSWRFQQLTGPVTAKSVEDTAFYRWLPLASANEVGADPARPATTPSDLHAAWGRIVERWPITMVSSSTHDTKRSEDVRARIALLTEMPGEWATVLAEWRSAAARAWKAADEAVDPDLTLEHLLYQTLIGAHPLSPARATAYLVKAAREAKMRTSWLAPDERYESTLGSFVENLLDDPAFQLGLDEVSAALTIPARMSSLGRLLLKLTAPGVPDTYQGCELWTTSLVDPDNRGSVDYVERSSLLDEVEGAPTMPEIAGDDPARSKLWLLATVLRLRAQRPDAFGPSAGTSALVVRGLRSSTTVANMRGSSVVVVVGTRPLALHREGWGDTTVALPARSWVDVLHGGTVDVDHDDDPVVVRDLVGPSGSALLVAAG